MKSLVLVPKGGKYREVEMVGKIGVNLFLLHIGKQDFWKINESLPEGIVALSLRTT